MSGLSIKKLLFILVCINTLNAQRPRVTKHTRPTKKVASSESGDNGDKNDLIKESYTAGICKQGEDDAIIYNTSYVQCLMECRSRNQCKSVNVYSNTNVCRLNFQTNLHMRPCPKYIYSEKANWKMKSIQGCENFHCKINQRCSVQPKGPVCVPVECPNLQPLQNGVVFGNLVEIGKKRGFRCNQGYSLIGSKAITCQADGKWSADPPICLPENSHSSKTPTTTGKLNTTNKAEVNKTSDPTASPTSTNETTTILINDTTSTYTNGTTSAFTNETTPAYTNGTTSIFTNDTTPAYANDTTPAFMNDTATTLTADSTIISNPISEDLAITMTPFEEISTTTMLDQSEHSGAGVYDSPCQEISDCKSFLECRDNRCKCKFKTVYDRTSGKCTKDCDELGDTFQRFTNLLSEVIHGRPLTTYNVDREEECETECLSIYNCTFATTFLAQGSGEDSSLNTFLCFIYTQPLYNIVGVKEDSHVTYLRDCRDGSTYPTSQSGTTSTSTKSDKAPTTLSSSLPASTASLASSNRDKQSPITTTTVSTAVSTTTNPLKTFTDREQTPASQTAWNYHSPLTCPPGSVYEYSTNACRPGKLQLLCDQDDKTLANVSKWYPALHVGARAKQGNIWKRF